MAALLYDGVQAYVAYAMAKGRAKRARYREAFNWVNTPDWDSVFGFDNVCECLGLDPDFLRDGLGSIANTRDFEWTRSRRVM